MNDPSPTASGKLAGKRILITRAREQAGATADALRLRGAIPVCEPTIEIAPVDATIPDLGPYTWVVFTSANGVEFSWRALDRQGRGTSELGAKKIAVIGPATKGALNARGVQADVVAEESRGEGLAAALLSAMAGDRAGSVLILSAKVARDALPSALRAAGLLVDIVPVYETRPRDPEALSALRSQLAEGRIDAVLFTSGSTATHFARAFGEDAAPLLARSCVACIGPVTADVCREIGLRVDVVSEQSTTRALIDAIDAYFQERN